MFCLLRPAAGCHQSNQSNPFNQCRKATLSQAFLEYGLWQDFGTGKEPPRGNPGDIGHDRKRQPRRWFSRKYYASVMNLRDFMVDSIGQEFVGIVAKAIDDKYRRYNH